MAEDSMDLPLTPEATKQEGVDLRRNSTGKASSGNGKEKILPRYLRPSTGSCHDACKYGKKHEFEGKEKTPLSARITRKSPGGRNSEEKANLSATKKTPMVNLKASLNSNSQLPDISDTDKHVTPKRSPLNQKQMERKVPGENTQLVKGKLSPLEKSSAFNTPKNIKHDGLTSKEVEIISQPVSSRPKEIKLSANHVNLLKSQSSKGKSMPCSYSPKHFTAKGNNNMKPGKKTAISEVAKESLQKPSRVSLSPKVSLQRIPSVKSRRHPGVKFLSHLKGKLKARKDEQKQYDNDEVPEKTLYVINIESKAKTSEADRNGSQALENNNVKNAETFDGENKKPIKLGMARSRDKDSQSLKLKFRRGKVVEIQPEKTGARRLKFRRGKTLEESKNAKADAGRGSQRRRDGAAAAAATVMDASAAQEKVVLRHQDVQGKKDGQVLFNNVIEETASKLVETRKSKVKALVGAFETVISLQENKPSFNNAS